MRAVLQRVTSASVSIGGETVGAIGRGLLVLVGKEDADTAEHGARMQVALVNDWPLALAD